MLGSKETALAAKVSDFARAELMPGAPEWSMGKEPEFALFKRVAELGLMGMEVPERLGGLGFNYAFKAHIGRLLAAVDFGFSMSVINTANVAARLARSASDDVQAKYLPRLLQEGKSACTALTETNAGSDFAAVTTRADKVTGGWELTGEKVWITNARRANLALVYAQCGTQGDRNGIGAFLLPLETQGCRIFPLDSPYQQTSIGLGGFVMEACFVPEDHLILAPGQAFKEIMSEINGARVYVAAMCDAMLKAALDEVATYGEQRETFGKPLLAHQGWRLMLARAETDSAALTCLVDRAIALVDSDSVSAAQEDPQLVSAQAKIFAVETCKHHLPALMHLMGAEGLKPNRPLIRHIAATHSAGLADGSTEMLLERVAKRSRSSINKS